MGDDDVGVGLDEEDVQGLQGVRRVDVGDEGRAEPLRVEHLGGKDAHDLLSSEKRYEHSAKRNDHRESEVSPEGGDDLHTINVLESYSSSKSGYIPCPEAVDKRYKYTNCRESEA